MRAVLRWVGVVLAAIALTGCQTRPPMSRADYLGMTTRVLPGITVDQAYAVLEGVFQASRPGDFEFQHSDAGMQASTRHGIFAGPPHVWSLTVQPVAGGVRVQASVSGSAPAGLLPVATTGGMGLAAGTASGVPVAGTSIYDLFFARVDYMMGKRADWVTCRQQLDRVLSNVVWGQNEALCVGLEPPGAVAAAPVLRSSN